MERVVVKQACMRRACAVSVGGSGAARVRGECYVTLDGRPAAADMRAGAAAGAGVASGAVERVGASEASRGEAEPLRKRVTAQRGNERRGTSRFVGCGMGERPGGRGFVECGMGERPGGGGGELVLTMVACGLRRGTVKSSNVKKVTTLTSKKTPFTKSTAFSQDRPVGTTEFGKLVLSCAHRQLTDRHV